MSLNEGILLQSTNIKIHTKNGVSKTKDKEKTPTIGMCRNSLFVTNRPPKEMCKIQ